MVEQVFRLADSIYGDFFGRNMDGVLFCLRSARLFVEQQYKGQLGVWSTKSAFQVTVSEAVTAFSLDCR